MKDRLCTDVVFRMCSVKNVFLQILQNLLENTSVKVSFLKNCTLALIYFDSHQLGLK